MDDARQYQDVIAYLNALDAQEQQRKLHRLPHECYTWSDCEFFFTLCARQHRRPFTDDTLATRVMQALLWYREHRRWRLFCYCLMPDHLHFLLQLPEGERRHRDGGARGVVIEGVLEQVGDFKSYTTSQSWWKVGGSGALWQKSSYDHVIRYNNSMEAAVNYVLQNPVRKGLVDTWEAYPYAKIVDTWK